MTQFEKLLKTPLILSATLATLIIISAPSSVFGAGDEPGKYLDRKAEIWNLFFKMMVVAFTMAPSYLEPLGFVGSLVGNHIQHQVPIISGRQSARLVLDNGDSFKLSGITLASECAAAW